MLDRLAHAASATWARYVPIRSHRGLAHPPTNPLSGAAGFLEPFHDLSVYFVQQAGPVAGSQQGNCSLQHSAPSAQQSALRKQQSTAASPETWLAQAV